MPEACPTTPVLPGISANGGTCDRVGGRADDDHPPAGSQAADGGAHRGGCGHRGQDRRRAAERLQGVGHVGPGGVDVVVGAERPRLLLLVRAAGDRDGLEAHPAGELHAEVAEAADAEDGDEVARTARRSRAAR